MMKFLVAVISVVVCVNCAKANYQDGELSLDKLNQQNAPCAKLLEKSSLCVDLVWKQLQTEDVRGVFELSFYRLDQPTVLVEPAATLAVSLWMPSMGHGSAPVKLEKISDGHYVVSEVYFVMSGDWDIRIQQKQGKQIIDQAIFPFVAP